MMMTKSKYVLCLSLLCSLFFASCGEEKQGTNILFYPLKNIYYDQDIKKYYVFDTAARNWKKEKELSVAGGALGKSALIPNPAVPVYSDNAQHRLIYGTALYTDRNDIRRKYVEDSIASLPPPVVVEEEKKKEEKKEEKKKSGFRKWIDKIFGKD
jgi:hypothetical protein